MPEQIPYNLLIFDADGTILERDTGEILPGVRDFFERLRTLPESERPQVAIATNQGGVGMRHWMEKGRWGEPSKFPSQIEIEERYPRIVESLLGDVPHHFYVAYSYRDRRGNWSPIPEGQEENPRWERSWRKPEAGMLLQAMADAGVTPAETLMIGDSTDDRGAAEMAGCDFRWADEFFGRSDHAENGAASRRGVQARER